MVYLNVVLIVFLIDLLVDYFVLRIFQISYRSLYLLFLQIPKICGTLICLFFLKQLWVCFLVRIISKLLCVIFITNSFNIKKIMAIIFAEIILLFSIGGFLGFVIECINLSIEKVIMQKIPITCQFLIYFAVILYIFAIFKIIRFMEKNKFNTSFFDLIGL